MREAFLNYRIDNEGSSVKSGAKVFCVCDEYSSFEDFISSRPERFNAFKYILPVKKYETYLWNYNRLDGSLRAEFLKKMSEEFASAQERGLLDEKLFADVEWRELQMVINSPDSLHGKDLTVVPSVLNPYDHQKTRCVNGEISAAYLFAWRLKHAFR